ncbi:MAG: MarR family transcriptional regulator [Nocardioides sp.]|uniref:MarR family winged helix-turn-helix transcriptional regulator n=1 Tax=Nocardioides sp. TaxID=35761 RepID=UPI0039E3C98D
MDPALGAQLLSAIARLNRWANRTAGVTESVAAARLLAVIEELDETRIGDLAKADNCSQPTVTTQVARLYDAGWVAKQADPDDARAVRVSLTASGRAYLAATRAARAEAVRPRLEQLDQRQLATLTEAVGILEQLATPGSSGDASTINDYAEGRQA